MEEQLELKSLSRTQLDRLYARELSLAFPPEERRPLASIHRLQDAGRYDALGLFSGEALLGYAFLWRTADDALALLDYLGVIKARQNEGLGSRLLALTRLRCGPETALLAEVEAPCGEGPLLIQQLRRLEFYRRGGFCPAGFDCLLFGVRYRLLAAGPGGRAAFLRGYRRLYQENLPDALFQAHIRIPLEGHAAADPEQSSPDTGA